MSNKVASVNSSNLLDNKLAVILEDMRDALKEEEVAERELILSRFNEVINKFYRTLNSPLLEVQDFRVGSFPNIDEINERFKETGQDIDLLYREVNSLQSYIISNFNTLQTQGEALRGRLRRVASQLGDYKLYAQDNLGGATYFGESFENSDKLDYEDRLYDEEKCSIDIDSGAITLPVNVDKTKTYSVVETVIGSGSNGTPGNNQQINSLLRGELKTITDENPDTWFEYESVTANTTSIPLILELKLTLDKESIVNTISIGSTAFATRRFPRVTKLEVSLDGKEFTDVIDDVPSSTFFGDTRDKVVLLDPSSGKFSGETKIKIPPTKAKHVNIVIQQDDSYTIKTPSGLRYRKAVGIRGIDIAGEVYESKGEIVSTNYFAQDEIKKVSLIANSQTIDGLTGITHYVSVDDGQNWNEIQAVDKIGKEIKEILNFNLESVDSITTSNPATSIRHKALLERISNGFSARGGVERTRESASDFRTISGGTKEIELSQRPITSTVTLKNVSFGTVGGEDYHLVRTTDTIDRDGFKFVYLPIEPFAQSTIELDQEIVIINNEIWTRVSDITAEASDAKAYEFDYINNIIKFGDDTTGTQPTTDIQFGLERERVQISNDAPKVAMFTFDSDGVKETTKLYRLGQAQDKLNYVFPKNAKVHRLNVEDVQSITITQDLAGILSSEKTFSNGSSELEASGDYSIDYLKGNLYTYDQSPEDSDVIIDISYRPRISVEEFTTTDSGLEIADADYVAELKKDTIVLGGSTKAINLNSETVEPRSLRFLSQAGSFKTEVPFKGDGTEFDIGLPASELDGYYTVDYKNGIIYFYSSVSGTFVIEYNAYEYYAEYNIAVEVPKDDYEVDEEANQLILTDRYIIKQFTDALARPNIRSLFKAEYEYVVELTQNPRELERYFTPLLKDYALAILTRSQI